MGVDGLGLVGTWKDFVVVPKGDKPLTLESAEVDCQFLQQWVNLSEGVAPFARLQNRA